MSVFKKAFLMNMNIVNTRIYRKSEHLAQLKFRDMEIVCDVPSHRYRKTLKKQIHIINHAKKSVLIENPYFLPNRLLRKSIVMAARRGVNVVVILPRSSDVKSVDILPTQYLGKLYKRGIKIRYYEPDVLHSKILLVDNKWFVVGSSNMDNRSATLHFEINLFGTNKKVIELLDKHIKNTLKDTVPFDFEEWKKRPLTHKIWEKVLSTIQYLF